MRTTLTLDEEIAEQLHELARKRGDSFKGVVNEVLRKGLESSEQPAGGIPRFVVHAENRPFRSDVDVARLNQLADELEIEDFERKLAHQNR